MPYGSHASKRQVSLVFQRLRPEQEGLCQPRGRVSRVRESASATRGNLFEIVVPRSSAAEERGRGMSFASQPLEESALGLVPVRAELA